MICLLIETKDKRKFLTHQKNLNHLKEFSKVFNVDISPVKLKTGNVLELEELVSAICDSSYNDECSFEKMKKSSSSRSETIKIANKIRDYIITEFKNKNNVSLKNIKNKFKDLNLTDASLCNHIRRAKIALQSEGYTFTKISSGIYRMI